MNEKKICPYCGEEILAVAKKCRHCGEWLDNQEEITPSVAPQHSVSQKKSAKFLLFMAALLAIAVLIFLVNYNGKSEVSTTEAKADPYIHFAEPEGDECTSGGLVSSKESAPVVTVDERKPLDESDIDDSDSEELLNTGECYEKGIGVDEDLETALYYYQKAAETGSPVALNKLGNMYAQGKGCVKDMVKAASYYLAAAEKGNKYAQHNIAFCYWDGTGVRKDRETAIIWMRRSAAQGYEKAINALKTMGAE